MIKKISDAPSVEAELVEDDEEKIPLLSATDEIKKPISPRAIMAKDMMPAGYSDRGLLGVLIFLLLLGGAVDDVAVSPACCCVGGAEEDSV